MLYGLISSAQTLAKDLPANRKRFLKLGMHKRYFFGFRYYVSVFGKVVELFVRSVIIFIEFGLVCSFVILIT